ncbi:GNAT family N-acetyltransferase, partial [Candidatus Pelagibacter sp.]|nr:GNAT family N-acetyltransferase [Candidatus Pelagibacter sp.]
LLIIVIDKEFHRKNLGSKLINASLEDNYFKNFKEIKVITLKKDIKNINFYEKNNFKQFREVYGRIFLKYDLPR